jgi:glycosyltransferase involved in cell wall biosynthesis
MRIPYSTMEWDLLDGTIGALDLVGPLQRREVGRVAALRERAASRGVASEGMVDHYRTTWSLDSIVLRQPATRVSAAPRLERARGERLVIAVCGNVYAPAEFQVLLAALDRLGWSIGGRPVDVQVIGQMAVDVGPLPARVTVSGWVSYEESLARLAGADVGYCPYWFDPRRAALVATSFPSKFISYLTCGVPVFYHGPATGTPAAFLSRYPAGIACHSLDPDTVADALGRFAGSPERLHAARRAADQAIEEELSAETLRGRIASLIGR